MSSNYPPGMTAADHAYLDGYDGCEHEHAYVQDIRCSVYIKDGNWADQDIVKGKTGTTYTSDSFTLQLEHYCPKCGKTAYSEHEIEDDSKLLTDSQEVLLGD